MATIAVLVGLVPASAAANPMRRVTSDVSPFEVDARIEIPIVLTVGFGAMLPRLLIDEVGPPSCNPDCDPNDVNPFDRWVIGNHSATAGAISDVAFFSSLALPYAFSALDTAFDGHDDGIEGWAKDNLVMLETMMFTLATCNVTQFVFARARPLVYDPEHFTEEERTTGTHMLSFPAGHVASNFAMATTYGWIYMRRHPHSPWIVPVWLSGYALSTLNGYGRIKAGEHFLSDVLVGAALGTGIGIAVPLLHERRRGAEISQESSLSRIRVWPMPIRGGGFVALTLQ